MLMSYWYDDMRREPTWLVRRYRGAWCSKGGI